MVLCSGVPKPLWQIVLPNPFYIAFDLLPVLVYFEAYYCCFQVKAEIVKVEKYDEPIHKLIVDLISGLHITKLVMGLKFLKSSSSSRYAIAFPYNPTFLAVRF